MNENFRTDLTALARDLKAMCEDQIFCNECVLWRDGYCASRISSKAFDLEAVIVAVEAYRWRKKPCAEVIDRAVDIYTLEIEIERKGCECDLRSAEECAKHAMTGLKRFYNNSQNTVRVLSAKRFVRESHREDMGDEA